MSKHSPLLVARAGRLVTTTDLPLNEIAAHLRIGVRTLGMWKKSKGWTRPSAARWQRFPQNKLAAVQRLYENRGTVTDIAIVAGRSVDWIAKTAAAGKWTPRRESAAGRQGMAKPVSDAIAAIQAALRDPALTRADLVKLIERASALAAADALGGDRDAERNTQTLTRLAALVRNLPEEAAPPARKDSHAPDPVDHFPDADDLIEEIARRIEADANAWLDPRVLAAVAAAVP